MLRSRYPTAWKRCLPRASCHNVNPAPGSITDPSGLKCLVKRYFWGVDMLTSSGSALTNETSGPADSHDG